MSFTKAIVMTNKIVNRGKAINLPITRLTIDYFVVLVVLVLLNHFRFSLFAYKGISFVYRLSNKIESERESEGEIKKLNELHVSV